MSEDKKALPDFDEQDIAAGKLLRAIAADPRHRKEALQLIKKVAPDVSIPELDMEIGTDKKVDERLKPVLDENKKLAERLEAVERREAKDKWAKAHDLSDEEVVEVETLAKEKGITKADTAVEFYRNAQALGTPRGTRKPPAGTEAYLDKLNKVSPNNGAQLKKLAVEEATRLLQGRRAG